LSLMLRASRHRQVTNWRESCRISPRRQHAVTDHPPRHALSLPTAGRLWRAPNDALRPRDPRDQRVIEASLEISPEPRSLASFRTHSAIMWESRVFGPRKRAVLREHRAPRAFAVGPRGPRSRGRRKDFSGRLAPTRKPGRKASYPASWGERRREGGFA
jgi:hypothetical protein